MDLIAEMYWLAGLLEGEGTFVKGPPSAPTGAILRLAMTDEDVVCRAARLIGRAVVPWDRRSKPGRKRVYITTIKGAGALAVMRTIHPIMGERRQRQIARALAAPRAARPRALIRDEECGVPACERRVRSRGLCRQHYHQWWKASQRGRTPKYTPSELLPPAASLSTALGVPTAEDPNTVLWLAGLLEGEGSFSDAVGYPDISITMCDPDVLERAGEILGTRTVSPRRNDRITARGWSPQFEIGLCGSRASEWMQKLRPFMGARRTVQIDAALAAYHPIRLTKPPETCIFNGCEAPHRSRGLCHKHYMSWTRDRERGRTPRVTPLR